MPTLVVICIFGLAIFVFINKAWCFWCRNKVCLVGKTAIITGGASGIGFQIALALASKGCRIIIADKSNLSESVEDIIKQTCNPNVIGKKIELTNFKSVRTFAKEILDQEPRLDILICNAGIGSFRVRDLTEDGYDQTMQINYLSHFLLTHLLLGLLKKTAPSRIIFSSSLAAYLSDMTIESLNPPQEYYTKWYRKFNGGIYSNSKLALAAAAKSFGGKLKATGVTANAVHIGGVKTNIYINAVKHDRNFFEGLLFTAFIFLYGKSPEQGAQTLIDVAHAEELKNVTGQSFVEGMQFFRPFQVYSDEFCENLWKASIELINMKDHEIGC